LIFNSKLLTFTGNFPASQDQKILQDHRKLIAQRFVQRQHQRGIAHAEVLPGGILWRDSTTKMGIQQQKWGFNHQKWGFNNKNWDSTTKIGI
jgi:hypothetical protein